VEQVFWQERNRARFSPIRTPPIKPDFQRVANTTS
jgi:hypothetical protein